jgi:membrane-bound ClpP family serine protease
MVEPWVWAVLLLVLGLGLAILEVFFPSAGILAFLSAAAMLAAIIMGFRQNPGIGLGILAAAVVGVPVLVVLAFRYWPKTAMGKRVLLTAPRAEDVLPDDPDRRRLKGLVGQIGRAKCNMLPGGVVAVDGHNVDAVSEGMAIEAGQPVRVIKVQGGRVVVRSVEEETPSPTAEDPLERPIDSILTDPFQEPPA